MEKIERHNRKGCDLPIEKMIFSYWERHWKLIIGLYLVTFAVYGSWLVKDIVTFDAEGLYNPQFAVLWYEQWYRLGRWMLVLLKHILGVSVINPYFSNMVFFMGFPASIILWLFLIERWYGKESSILRLIFALVYLCHPIWALMFSYRMHTEVLVIGMCMLPIGMALFVEWIEKRSIISGCISFAIIVCCFGSFQSFMFMYADACAIYMFLQLWRIKGNSLSSLWQILTKMILFMAAAFVCWYIISRVICMIKGLPYGDSYLSNQFLWGKRPAVDNIRTIVQDICESMFGNEREYSSIYGVASVIFFVRCLIDVVQKKEYALLGLIVAIGIWGIPYALVVVTGYPIAVRSRYAFVLSCAFMSAIDLMWVTTIVAHMNVEVKKWICVILGFLMIFPLTQITTRLLYTNVRVMEQDKRMFGDIYERAMQMGAEENYSLYFDGWRGNFADESLLEVEVVGFSYSEVNDSNKNVQAMRAYGFSVLPATEKQMEEAKIVAQELTVWPHAESMKVIEEEKLIVVNMR